MLIDPIQLYTTIPRSIEVIIYLIITLKLSSRLKKTPNSGYILKKNYVLMFIFWMIYMILDLISAIIPGFSITIEFVDSLIFVDPEVPIIFTNYNSPVLSLTLGCIIKDIQLLFGIAFIFFLYRTSMIMKYGEEKGLLKAKSIVWLFIGTISALFIILFDVGGVMVFQNYTIIVTYNLETLSMVGLFINLGLVTYSSLLVVVEFLKNKNNLDQTTKKRLFKFSLGYISIVMGLWWWVIAPIFGIDNNLIVFQSTGHALWIISPILFYQAMNIKLTSKYDIEDRIKIN